MSAKPKFSVVMPVFNASATLASAINSILRQTFRYWELVIVDDGSTDNPKAIVDKFKDKRIKFFQIKHEGIVFARNYGNSQAKSDWIVMQDADDLSLPDRLERLTKHIKEADVIVPGFYLNMWDEQYQCIMRTYNRPGDIKKILKAQTLSGVCAFKKKLWEKKPFRLETQYCFDWMMHLDWIYSGAKYALPDEGLYEYIRYKDSASQRFENSGLRAESIREIKRIMKDEYGQKVGTGVIAKRMEKTG